MRLSKCCIQYVSKFGKLSTGHSAGKGQFSFQTKWKEILKNVQPIMPLCSSHLLARSCSKSFKLCFNSTWTENFQIYKLVWGSRDQIANIHRIIEKARESQKNISICFTDYAKAFHCVDHNKLWKILKEMGVVDHLTFLLTSLYVGQKAEVRIRQGTTERFKIGKGAWHSIHCHSAYWTFM